MLVHTRAGTNTKQRWAGWGGTELCVTETSIFNHKLLSSRFEAFSSAQAAPKRAGAAPSHVRGACAADSWGEGRFVALVRRTICGAWAALVTSSGLRVLCSAFAPLRKICGNCRAELHVKPEETRTSARPPKHRMEIRIYIYIYIWVYIYICTCLYIEPFRWPQAHREGGIFSAGFTCLPRSVGCIVSEMCSRRAGSCRCRANPIGYYIDRLAMLRILGSFVVLFKSFW